MAGSVSGNQPRGTTELAARNAGGGFSAEGGVATKLRMLQIEKAQLGPEPGLFD